MGRNIFKNSLKEMFPGYKNSRTNAQRHAAWFTIEVVGNDFPEVCISNNNNGYSTHTH